MDDKINLLIRNKYRLVSFENCISSINNQSYGNIEIFVGCDSDQAFIHANTVKYRFPTTVINLRQQDCSGKAPWNLYCNELKSMVQSGFFAFVDNDDVLADKTVIERIAKHFDQEGIITQFKRNGMVKPNDFEIKNKVIRKGRIGGGCMVLNARHKDKAKWDAEPAGDFRWIESISKQVELKFVNIVFQIATQKGNGK